jgi:ketosteroid isomerase-like protein
MSSTRARTFLQMRPSAGSLGAHVAGERGSGTSVVEAFNRRDWVAWEAHWHREAEWHHPPEAPGSGVHHGTRAFSGIRGLPGRCRGAGDVGDRVVVVTTQHVIPKGGGQQEINVRFAEVWTVRDGLLVERHSDSTKEEALEAVGLQDQISLE